MKRHFAHLRLFFALTLLDLCWQAPSAAAADTEAIAKALRESFDDFPLLTTKRDNEGTLEWSSITLNRRALTIQGERYDGFRIQVTRDNPDWAFAWAYKQMENLAGWGMTGQKGVLNKFKSYGDMPNGVTIQALEAEAFKDGAHYLIWFKFTNEEPVKTDVIHTFEKFVEDSAGNFKKSDVVAALSAKRPAAKVDESKPKTATETKVEVPEKPLAVVEKKASDPLEDFIANELAAQKGEEPAAKMENNDPGIEALVEQVKSELKAEELREQVALKELEAEEAEIEEGRAYVEKLNASIAAKWKSRSKLLRQMPDKAFSLRPKTDPSTSFLDLGDKHAVEGDGVRMIGVRFTAGGEGKELLFTFKPPDSFLECIVVHGNEKEIGVFPQNAVMSGLGRRHFVVNSDLLETGVNYLLCFVFRAGSRAAIQPTFTQGDFSTKTGGPFRIFKPRFFEAEKILKPK